MRALVIGGTRFFGKRLVTLLLNQGAEVTLLTRGKTPDSFGERVKRIRMDRRELTASDLEGWQPWDIVYDQVCFDAMEAASACTLFQGKTKQYVFTSTQCVYGPGAAALECAFDPTHYVYDQVVTQTEDYCEAKRQAETAFFKQSSLPVVAVRFPIVLGEDDHTGRLKFHVDRIAQGLPIYFPNLKAKISFIHASDAAQFLFRLSEKAIHGPVNCSASDPIQLNRLVSAIEEIVDRRAILDRSGAQSPYGIEQDWWMSTSRLNQVYGFYARPIETWLAELVRNISSTRRVHTMFSC